jgi:hypothetical protein
VVSQQSGQQSKVCTTEVPALMSHTGAKHIKRSLCGFNQTAGSDPDYRLLKAVANVYTVGTGFQNELVGKQTGNSIGQVLPGNVILVL